MDCVIKFGFRTFQTQSLIILVHTFTPKKVWVWVSYLKHPKIGYETQDPPKMGMKPKPKPKIFFSFFKLYNVFSFQIYYFEINS